MCVYFATVKLTCVFRQSDTVCGDVFAEQNGPLTRMMMHVKTEQYTTSYTLHRISGIFQVINNDMNVNVPFSC